MNKNEHSQYIESLLQQRLREDDEKALSYLFATYYNILFRAGIRWSNDFHLAEESIQEVFQDLWHYRHSISEIVSFEAYLKTSLKNKVAKKSKRKFNFFEDNIDLFTFSVSSYEQILIEQEDSEKSKIQIKKALEELSPPTKRINCFKIF